MISGNFSQGEADDLAKLINYGSLPVQLKQISVENVSPTLGQDQLNAGIIAGVIGLALVALYMLFYYRLLGLVVIAGSHAERAGALLADQLPRVVASGSRSRSPVSPASSCRSVSPSTRTSSTYERLKDEVRAGAPCARRSTAGSRGRSARSSPPTSCR